MTEAQLEVELGRWEQLSRPAGSGTDGQAADAREAAVTDLNPIGVRIDVFPDSRSSALAAIFVPPQPPALQPFLVRGSLRGGRNVRSQIAIFKRQSDATTVVGAEELHSLLVAGRAALAYDRESTQT